jgi:hypothetical protein
MMLRAADETAYNAAVTLLMDSEHDEDSMYGKDIGRSRQLRRVSCSLIGL